jgi:hypothetical protein
MKETISLSPRGAEAPVPHCSAVRHDFNLEGIMANNFGQGDDWEALDPMRDPRIVEVLCQRKRSA